MPAQLPYLLKSLIARFHSLFRKNRMEDDLAEELQFHLQNEIQKNIAAGMAPKKLDTLLCAASAGWTRSRSNAGTCDRSDSSKNSVKTHDTHGECYARALGFTTVAVVTLALGIGTNTAIFSLLHAVMLRSLPVRDPEHLFVLKWTAKATPEYQGYSQFEPCFDDGNRPVASGCSLFPGV